MIANYCWNPDDFYSKQIGKPIEEMLRNDKRSIALVIFILMYGSFIISYGVYYLSIEFVDLPSFYYAADAVFTLGISPYSSELLNQAQESLGQTVFPFIYHPPSLIFFYLYSIFSYQTAATLTLIINHLLILVFIYLFLFKILELRLEDTFMVLGVAYIFLYHPLVVTLNRGQVNLWVLVSLCLSWYFLKKDRHPGIIAFPLSLAILLKLYPAIFLIYLLARRKLGIVVWVLGFLSFFTLTAYIILPKSIWIDWITNVLPTGGYGKIPHLLYSPAAPHNQSINGFTSRLFLANEFSETLIPYPEAGIFVPYLISFSLIIVTFICLYMSKEGSDIGMIIDFEYSLVLLTMFLVAPISWEHHLVYVLPSAIIALNVILVKNSRNVFSTGVVVSILLLAWRYPHWAKILKGGIFTLGISLKFFAVLCIWIFFAVLLWQSIREARFANL